MRNTIAVLAILGALGTYATWQIMSQDAASPAEETVVLADISSEDIANEGEVPAATETVEVDGAPLVEGETVTEETVLEDAAVEVTEAAESHDGH